MLVTTLCVLALLRWRKNNFAPSVTPFSHLLARDGQVPTLAVLLAITLLGFSVGCGAKQAETAKSSARPAESPVDERNVDIGPGGSAPNEQSSEWIAEETLPAEAMEIVSVPMAPALEAPRPAADPTKPSFGSNRQQLTMRSISSPNHSRKAPQTDSREFVAITKEYAAEKSVEEPIAAIKTEDVPKSAAESKSKHPVRVEIFYATDRKRVASIASGDLWKVFGWALQLGVVALAVGTLGSFRNSQSAKLIAAAACIGSLVLSYGGWIEWQQRSRIKDNGNVWYTHDIKIASPSAATESHAVPQTSESLDYGRCIVSIPPNHQTGIVEAPSITRFEITEDREKHVVLESITQTPSSKFFGDLNDRLSAGSKETLVFIHGYNVSFNDAVKRTAQISHDVKFQGASVCYSWPSHGGLEDYTRDMANADWSVIHLQEFLTSLFERTDATKIHLIAHSMGNRVLMQALDRLALQNQQDARFGQIVLAAPDVSANDFRQRYSNVIRNMADHVTLYASSRDRALMVSAEVHGHNRAGLAGTGIVIVDGIDTIDVSHVDTSLIGHSYYGDNPELIDDLSAIILQSKPTSSRTWLERIDTAANRFYWKFR